MFELVCEKCQNTSSHNEKAEFQCFSCEQYGANNKLWVSEACLWMLYIVGGKAKFLVGYVWKQIENGNKVVERIIRSWTKGKFNKVAYVMASILTFMFDNARTIDYSDLIDLALQLQNPTRHTCWGTIWKLCLTMYRVNSSRLQFTHSYNIIYTLAFISFQLYDVLVWNIITNDNVYLCLSFLEHRF